MARRPRPRFFHGPAADSALGEALLDSIGIVAAVGFAADVSHCVQLCGVTFRAGDRGAANDMLVQSLRLQCGAREARAAGREQYIGPMPYGMLIKLDTTTQLIRAVMLNNLPRVLQLIQLGAPLDLIDETWGRSALHWASYLGLEHVTKALLDGKYEKCGATVDLRDKDTLTALMRASFLGHEAVVRLLLSRGAKQELQYHNGSTALHCAVRGDIDGDHTSIVAQLCAAPGAAVALKLKDFDGRTPLAMAILDSHSSCEAVLRAHGAPGGEDADEYDGTYSG